MKVMIQNAFGRFEVFSMSQVPAKGERVIFNETATTVIDVLWVLGDKNLDALISVE